MIERKTSQPVAMAILISSILLLLLFSSITAITQSQTPTGYAVSIPPEQLIFNGSVEGNLWDLTGRLIQGVNVSIWQDGQMVNTADNPQLVDKKYRFDHLAPGMYKVEADVVHGGACPGNTSVIVNDSTVIADIRIPIALPAPPIPTDPPSSHPTTTAKPSVTPTPFPGMIIVLTSIVVGVMVIRKFEKP